MLSQRAACQCGRGKWQFNKRTTMPPFFSMRPFTSFLAGVITLEIPLEFHGALEARSSQAAWRVNSVGPLKGRCVNPIGWAGLTGVKTFQKFCILFGAGSHSTAGRCHLSALLKHKIGEQQREKKGERREARRERSTGKQAGSQARLGNQSIGPTSGFWLQLIGTVGKGREGEREREEEAER